mmetsp:Transcript_8933/g.18217  ORF Transcript_8933/g.18217 Transcript_8933/m.18217 type:complete len:120 (+) Transcript_8933:4349-4708(+)
MHPDAAAVPSSFPASFSNQFSPINSCCAVAYLTDSDSTATAPALSGVGAAPPGGWSLSLLITVLLSASLQPGYLLRSYPTRHCGATWRGHFSMDQSEGARAATCKDTIGGRRGEAEFGR